MHMRTAFLLFFLLWLAIPASAKPWYETLRPGVTRREVLIVAGPPTSSVADEDTYQQAQGYILCRYRGDVMEQATYYEPPGGGISAGLYWTGDEAKAIDVEARRAYLKGGKFAVLPKFGGTFVRTSRYDGLCYEVDGQFIVVEPIIPLMGGTGCFADKAARVLLIGPDGSERVLYRAADHWAELRPPGVSEGEVILRTTLLKAAGVHLLDAPVPESFGAGDSTMGSGVDYRLYYLRDGLLTAVRDYSSRKIVADEIVRPGLGKFTVEEWLAGDEPARSATSPR